MNALKSEDAVAYFSSHSLEGATGSTSSRIVAPQCRLFSVARTSPESGLILHIHRPSNNLVII